MKCQLSLENLKFLVLCAFALDSIINILTIVSYVLPWWIIYQPYSTDVPSTWAQFYRSRGIFQECMTSFITPDPQVSVQYTINKQQCILNDIGQFNIGTNSRYDLIIKLRQSVIGLHGLAVLLLLLTLFFGIGIFFKWFTMSLDEEFYNKWRNVLGFMAFMAFLCLAISCSIMTILLTYVEVETKYKTNLLPYSQFNQFVLYNFGAVFYLAWTATGLSLVLAILFFVSSTIGRQIENEKYKIESLGFDNHIFKEEFCNPNHEIFLAPSLSSNSYSGILSVFNDDSIAPSSHPFERIPISEA